MYLKYIWTGSWTSSGCQVVQLAAALLVLRFWWKTSTPEFLYSLSNCIRGQNYYVHWVNLKGNYFPHFVDVYLLSENDANLWVAVGGRGLLFCKNTFISSNKKRLQKCLFWWRNKPLEAKMSTVMSPVLILVMLGLKTNRVWELQIAEVRLQDAEHTNSLHLPREVT